MVGPWFEPETSPIHGWCSNHWATLPVSDGVRFLAYSPDGSRIIFGSYDKFIRIWDANTDAVGKPLEGNTGSVWSVACTPDRQLDSMIRPTVCGTHFHVFLSVTPRLVRQCVLNLMHQTQKVVYYIIYLSSSYGLALICSSHNPSDISHPIHFSWIWGLPSGTSWDHFSTLHGPRVPFL